MQRETLSKKLTQIGSHHVAQLINKLADDGFCACCSDQFGNWAHESI